MAEARPQDGVERQSAGYSSGNEDAHLRKETEHIEILLLLWEESSLSVSRNSLQITFAPRVNVCAKKKKKDLFFSVKKNPPKIIFFGYV